MAYVYRFLNGNNDVIYIGKTCRKLDKRMEEHFGGKGHLVKECYANTFKIEYMTFKTDADSLLVETYLINKYRPQYNRQNKSNHVGQTIKLDIEENWKTYRVLKVAKTKEALNMSIWKSFLFKFGIGIIFLLILLLMLANMIVG